MNCLHAENGVIIRGKQRVAVYEALNRPLNGKEILSLARAEAPSMTYQDLRHILRDFQSKGIAECLNSECQTGRLYVRAGMSSSFSEGIIQLSAKVRRASIRQAVLAEIGREALSDSKPLTATQIKKRLREAYPLGLNHVLATIKFLEGEKLIEVIGHTDLRGSKIYGLSAVGLELMKTMNAIHNSENSPTR